jgi:hypothetical protein
MPAQNPTKILEGIVQGRGREAKVRRKLVANKERNWLLGLTLNSFAKLDANASLTDLDQSIVHAFRQHQFTDEELKEHGRLYQQLPEQTRRDLFPGKFAGLTPRTIYAIQDLRQDAPNIVRSVLSMRNVENIDVEAIHAGRAHIRDFPPISRDVLQEHGGAMLVALAPNRTRPNPRYTVKATSFKCNDRATDSIFGPSNEIYWIFGSLGSGTAITTRSRIFGDVDSGEGRNFGATEGCIWGQDCAAQDFPEGEIGSMIQLWEHDEGNVDKIQAGFAAAFAAAAGILAATGVASWVGAVVAGVGAVLQWLLGFLNDDHIADQTIVYTRQVVEDQLRKAGQSFNLVRRFTDGDGDFTLTITTTRFA